MHTGTLYKYLHPDRVDVVQHLRIRFTQVSALNDPFESLSGIIQKDRGWYLQQFSARVDAEILRLGITSGSKKKQHRRARKKKFNNFLKCYTDQDWLLKQSEYVQHMADNIQGCLSLSGTPTNVLMWSHYCQHHTGYVIGFDPEHEFFGRSVRQVVYSDIRPAYNPLETEHSAELFYTKSKDWSYEQEYRKFQSFVEPIEMSDGHKFVPFRNPELKKGANSTVVLFPLPKESITCLILGWKSSPKLEEQLRLALEQHNMAHTRVYRARPSPTRYEMEVVAA
jgi:hypothetical protein